MRAATVMDHGTLLCISEYPAVEVPLAVQAVGAGAAFGGGVDSGPYPH